MVNGLFKACTHSRYNYRSSIGTGQTGYNGTIFSKLLQAGKSIVSSFKFYTMLRWTVIFLVIAIIAAVFGFGGIAVGAASIAKILFFIFIVLFLLSLIFGKSATRNV